MTITVKELIHCLQKKNEPSFQFGTEQKCSSVLGREGNTDVFNTRVIALYIEGITRGRAFLEAARAITPHKTIVAFYVGGSNAGKAAVFSHTGAMAGPDELYEGMFRQAGVIRARSVLELFEACCLPGSIPVPHGNRVVI